MKNYGDNDGDSQDIRKGIALYLRDYPNAKMGINGPLT